jgi:endoglucanase
MKQKSWLWSVVVVGAAMTFGCAEESAPAPTGSVAPAAVTAPACATHAPPPSRTLSPNTRFMVRTPDSDAVKQIAGEFKSGDLLDTIRLSLMAATPQSSWFTGGTPADVQAGVHKVMTAAALTHTVPVLVAYNIPFRDCAGYSAGGALDTASYDAWIDGFAAGIGKGQAVVVLEPDSLGIVPWIGDWCTPTVTDASGNQVQAPGADPATRFAQLNYAIDSIHGKAPAASVYLDGTHSGWLNVGDASTRLVNGGIARADGFYLNISNYQLSPNLAQYGTWISECIAYGTLVNPGDFGSCPNQYWNGAPLPSQIAQLFGEWNGVALDPHGVWSDTSTVQALDTSGINFRLTGMLNGVAPTTHFIIDSSRNGRGPLDATPFGVAPYGQPAAVLTALTNGNWCNPPGAGLGLRPTANTGVALLDAYLWVKIPGESDGSCAYNGGSGPRNWDYTQYDPWNVTGAAQDTFDPLWGMVDPAAGLWFSQQALQLADNATPPLL